MIPAQKEITSQTDFCLVILSLKTYVFDDKLTTSLTNYFFQCAIIKLKVVISGKYKNLNKITKI